MPHRIAVTPTINLSAATLSPGPIWLSEALDMIMAAVLGTCLAFVTRCPPALMTTCALEYYCPSPGKERLSSGPRDLAALSRHTLPSFPGTKANEGETGGGDRDIGERKTRNFTPLSHGDPGGVSADALWKTQVQLIHTPSWSALNSLGSRQDIGSCPCLRLELLWHEMLREHLV